MTDPAFQTSIIDLDMELKQPVCGTPGRSCFNWLLDVDRDHGTLLTGSGPPPADMKAGFCFFDKAGAVAGFVTLEDADAVKIADLGQSLCAFLTGSVGPDGKCERTGSALKAKGDYCSTTGEPGGCEDSVWIAATFAASAVAVQTDGCGG